MPKETSDNAPVDCRQILFSGHALRRIFERGIRAADVVALVRSGETIATYPDDTPYPSALLLGSTHEGQPLHVVAAHDQSSGRCYIITVYIPSQDRWDEGFRFRRIP